jgi:hypothetical protein
MDRPPSFYRGAVAPATQARLEPGCGAGVAAIAAIDQMHMLACHRRDGGAGHHRVVRDIRAIAQAATHALIELCAHCVDAVRGAAAGLSIRW